MDAVRISDGRRVLLKRFKLPANGRTELEINTLASSEPLKSNPRNPAIPMLDVIYAPGQCFMVFPFGQRLYDMRVDTVGEGLDFVEQTLMVRRSSRQAARHGSQYLQKLAGYCVLAREQNRT